MNGKAKCQMLREIRQRLAEENHIFWQEEPCTHTGPCSGTCPWCEQQTRKLEHSLKIVTACALAGTMTGCTALSEWIHGPEEEIVELSGEVPDEDMIDS